MSQIRPVPYSRFENQNFNDELIINISAVSFRGFTFEEGRTTISFSNCLFKKVRIINSELIDFKDVSIHFVDCFVESLNVENIFSQNISILFGSSIIALANINSSNLRYVGINNCFFPHSCFIQNVQKVHINYSEDNIFVDRWMDLFTKLKMTFLDLIKSKYSFYIYDCKEITFEFNENEDEEKLGVVNDSIANKNKFYLSKKQKEKLKFSLNLNYSATVDHIITKVQNGRFCSVQVSGHCTGEVQIENCRIDELYLRNFSTAVEAVFFDIKPKNLHGINTKFEIHKCNLDKQTFDNLSFANYASISLYRNKFGQSTNLISCDFPNDYKDFDMIKTIENIHYPERRNDNYYKVRYETFLQLKKVVENSGNFYEAQKFQMVSNHALRQIESIPRQDKFILWVNSFSNNHGLSIWKPFIWFLLFSSFFYIVYLWTLGKIFICSEIDWNLVGYYFPFLDLTHRSDFLVKSKCLTGWTVFIDYVNKVVTGFFLYQFIASFRKYGKRA